MLAEMQDVRNLTAIRDNFPAEFSHLLELLNISTEPLYWWNYQTLYSPDTMTVAISKKGIDSTTNWWKDNALAFPDGLRCSVSLDEQWIVREIDSETNTTIR